MDPDERHAPSTLPPPADALLGATIGGRYFIERELGHGGMGIVYAGRHLELQRRVAIKVLMPMWSTQREAVERFFREARTASSVGHPNIVDVYDLGRLPDQRPYLVMPMLDGVDLCEYVRTAGPQSEERVVELLAGVANALDLMHTKGLVHRDIKPDNMMLVVREDGEEVVKLLDFGLAALMHSSARITHPGAIFGTAHYMSPEAAMGEMPDARGDVYSLATVAFALLTNRLPFEDEHPMRVLTRKISENAIRLNDVSERVFSGDVEMVIAKSLALEPEERHATCGAFIEALRGACASASTPSGTERLPLPQMVNVESGVRTNSGTSQSRKHRLKTKGQPNARKRSWGLWIAAAVLTFGVAEVILWTQFKEEPSASSAEGSTNLPGPLEPSPSKLSSESQVPRLAADESELTPMATDSTGSGASGVAPAEMAVSAAEPLVEESPAEGAMTATAMTAMTATAMTTAMTTEQGPDPDPESGPTEDPQRAARLSREGTTAFAQGRLPAAVRMFREATQVAPRYSAAWRGLGLANERFGRTGEALRAYRRYLRLAPGAADASAIRARVTALQADL